MLRINSKSFVWCELMEGARVGALARKGKAKPVPLKPNRKTRLLKKLARKGGAPEKETKIKIAAPR
jgi:hypothetical protein